jgi:hypothetical protein
MKDISPRGKIVCRSFYYSTVSKSQHDFVHPLRLFMNYIAHTFSKKRKTHGIVDKMNIQEDSTAKISFAIFSQFLGSS